MNKKTLVAAAVALLAACLPLNAAAIHWSAAQTITGDADVSTAGTLVYAFSLGLPYDGTSSVSVGGVSFLHANHRGGTDRITFGGSPASFPAYGSASQPFLSLSNDYQILLQSGTYRNDGNGGAFTITLHGLTVGAAYQVQIWVNDSRGQYAAKIGGTRFDDGVTLEHNTADADGGLGQYAIGTFVATHDTRQITLASSTSAKAGAQINALQLRRLSDAPSPAR